MIFLKKRDELKKTIQKYSNQGNYIDAIPYMEQYVLLIQEEFGCESDRYVTVINDLGGMYRNIGDFINAKKTFDNALQIIENKLGNDCEQYATTTINLACMYRLTKEFEKAENLFLNAISIYDNDIEIQNILKESSCKRRAIIDKKYDNIKNEEDNFKAILYANASNNLGTLYQDMKQFDKAVQCHEKSLELLLNTNKYDYIAITLNNLVNPLIQQEKFDEALVFAKKSLYIFEHYLSTEHPFYLMSYNNLGAIYFHTHRFEEALKCFETVEKKLKLTYGKNSSEYKSAINNIEQVKKYLYK